MEDREMISAREALREYGERWEEAQKRARDQINKGIIEVVNNYCKKTRKYLLIKRARDMKCEWGRTLYKYVRSGKGIIKKESRRKGSYRRRIISKMLIRLGRETNAEIASKEIDGVIYKKFRPLKGWE